MTHVAAQPIWTMSGSPCVRGSKHTREPQHHIATPRTNLGAARTALADIRRICAFLRYHCALLRVLDNCKLAARQERGLGATSACTGGLCLTSATIMTSWAAWAAGAIARAALVMAATAAACKGTSDVYTPR